MSLSKERVYYLLGAYTSGQANADERSELLDWIREAGEDSELKNYTREVWEQYKPGEDLSYVDWKGMYASIVQRNVVLNKTKISWRTWTKVAAVFLTAIAAGTYFYTHSTIKRPFVAVQSKPIDVAPPASSAAVLTLADGTKIKMDKSKNGTLAVQGNVQIIKHADGTISYMGKATHQISYNTLSVPKGSKPLTIVLSDGSNVWINVGSSLKYPTAFMGSERKVEITGEAYFEVKHDAKMPFIVQHGNVAVKVLGTHFNVNTYNDQPDMKITLLEGSIRVTKEDKKETRVITPGQQAQVSENIKVADNVNLDEVMAWKNGKFWFGEKMDLSSVMSQVSRWYNVDVEYKGTISRHFWGSISRDVNLSQVLKILEATGGVKFKLEENRIIVIPVASP